VTRVHPATSPTGWTSNATMTSDMTSSPPQGLRCDLSSMPRLRRGRLDPAKKNECVWQPSFQDEGSSRFVSEGGLQFWNLCDLRLASPTKGKVVATRSEPPIDKDKCKWCKKKGHYKKNYMEFLKHMTREGEDHVIFVDESLFLSYAKSTWLIDSGATIHIANSLLGVVSRRILRRGERNIRVINDLKAEVEAIR
jgi:hypothetical protein